MEKDSRFKLKPVDMNLLYKQAKPRNRTRSTRFEDETDKAERRENRRLTEKKLVDEAIENELNNQVTEEYEEYEDNDDPLGFLDYE